MALLDDLAGRGAPAPVRCPGRAAGSRPRRPVDHRAPLARRLRPRSRSIASADTVVSRSSHSRTGTGAIAPGQPGRRSPAPWPPPALRPGQRPGQPDDHLDGLLLGDDLGEPGEVAPRRAGRSPRAWRGSRTGRCARPRSGRPRGRSRAVRRGAPASGPGRAGDLARAPAPSASSMREASEPPPWATSSLPPPLPPTSGPTARTSVVGADAAGAGLVVDRGDHRRPCRSGAGGADHDDRAGTPGVQPAAHVERERAHVAPPAPSARCATTPTPSTSVGGGRELAGRGEQLPDADLLDLLLGRPQPLDEVADPADEVVGLGLEQAGELRDDVALAGEVGEALDAGQRLDAAVARPDRGLPGDHDRCRSARSARRGCRRTARATRGRRSRRRGPCCCRRSRRRARPRPTPGLSSVMYCAADRQVGAQRVVRHLLDVADLLG